jgi:hypothetical protein
MKEERTEKRRRRKKEREIYTSSERIQKLDVIMYLIN